VPPPPPSSIQLLLSLCIPRGFHHTSDLTQENTQDVKRGELAPVVLALQLLPVEGAYVCMSVDLGVVSWSRKIKRTPLRMIPVLTRPKI
jgi:hypothetical protein